MSNRTYSLDLGSFNNKRGDYPDHSKYSKPPREARRESMPQHKKHRRVLNAMANGGLQALETITTLFGFPPVEERTRELKGQKPSRHETQLKWRLPLSSKTVTIIEIAPGKKQSRSQAVNMLLEALEEIGISGKTKRSDALCILKAGWSKLENLLQTHSGENIKQSPNLKRSIEGSPTMFEAEVTKLRMPNDYPQHNYHEKSQQRSIKNSIATSHAVQLRTERPMGLEAQRLISSNFRPSSIETLQQQAHNSLASQLTQTNFVQPIQRSPHYYPQSHSQSHHQGLLNSPQIETKQTYVHFPQQKQPFQHVSAEIYSYPHGMDTRHSSRNVVVDRRDIDNETREPSRYVRYHERRRSVTADPDRQIIPTQAADQIPRLIYRERPGPSTMTGHEYGAHYDHGRQIIQREVAEQMPRPTYKERPEPGSMRGHENGAHHFQNLTRSEEARHVMSFVSTELGKPNIDPAMRNRNVSHSRDMVENFHALGSTSNHPVRSKRKDPNKKRAINELILSNNRGFHEVGSLIPASKKAKQETLIIKPLAYDSIHEEEADGKTGEKNLVSPQRNACISPVEIQKVEWMTLPKQVMQKVKPRPFERKETGKRNYIVAKNQVLGRKLKPPSASPMKCHQDSDAQLSKKIDFERSSKHNTNSRRNVIEHKVATSPKPSLGNTVNSKGKVHLAQVDSGHESTEKSFAEIQEIIGATIEFDGKYVESFVGSEKQKQKEQNVDMNEDLINARQEIEEKTVKQCFGNEQKEDDNVNKLKPEVKLVTISRIPQPKPRSLNRPREARRRRRMPERRKIEENAARREAVNSSRKRAAESNTPRFPPRRRIGIRVDEKVDKQVSDGRLSQKFSVEAVKEISSLKSEKQTSMNVEDNNQKASTLSERPALVKTDRKKVQDEDNERQSKKANIENEIKTESLNVPKMKVDIEIQEEKLIREKPKTCSKNELSCAQNTALTNRDSVGDTKKRQKKSIIVMEEKKDTNIVCKSSEMQAIVEAKAKTKTIQINNAGKADPERALGGLSKLKGNEVKSTIEECNTVSMSEMNSATEAVQREEPKNKLVFASTMTKLGGISIRPAFVGFLAGLPVKEKERIAEAEKNRLTIIQPELKKNSQNKVRGVVPKHYKDTA